MNSLTPRKTYASFLAGLAVALTVAACGGGGGGGGGGDDGPVSLDEPDSVMEALDDKLTSSDGSLNLVRDAEPPESNSLNPKANDIPEITGTPGSVVTVPIRFSGTPELTALFAKVPDATSYFTGAIEGDGNGKAAVRAIPKELGSADTPPQTAIDLQIDLSGFQRGLNQDKLCLVIKFSGGTLQNGLEQVGEQIPVCVKLVDQAPSNDQPADAVLKSALIGSWASECIADGQGSSARLVFEFGANVTYGQSVEVYDSAACSGTPDTASVPGGVYEVGTANYSDSAGVWQREFNFNPNDFEGIDLEPCYNQLRVKGNKLYLGIPFTYTIDPQGGEAPVEGDCREPSTRPESVYLGYPFTKR